MSERIKILAGGRTLFMSVGIKSVSMDDIARHLGISKKTIYKHFSNKNELVKEILDTYLAQEKLACEKCFEADSNAIQNMIDMSHYVSQAHKNMRPAVLYDMQKYYPEQWQSFELFRTGFIAQKVENNIVLGQKEGTYRKEINPRIIANIYINLISATIQLISTQSSLNFQEVHLEMISYHLRGICTTKGITYLEKHINEI